MEKPVKPSKAKMILKFLPKSAAISFQSLPFSPGRDKRPADIKTHCSGPIISIIPAEARRKSGEIVFVGGYWENISWEKI
nr:uncharacterized protein At1g76070-like [Ipomoea batatas]